MPKGHLHFLVDPAGKPRTVKWLSHQFAKWAKAADLPDRCRLHGLKKAGMTAGAHDGMTPFELMAWSGHRDLQSVLKYTEKVDLRRLSDSGAAKRQAARK
jgi:integrase